MKAINYTFKDEIVSFDNYDKNKITAGYQIARYTSNDETEDFIGPLKLEVTRPAELQQGGVAMHFISTVTFSETEDWVFYLQNTTSNTRRISLYLHNKLTNSYTYQGFVTWVRIPSGTHTHRGFKMSLENYSEGKVSVSGTSVTGISTNWVTNNIPSGCRIGFGSKTSSEIKTWFEFPSITNDTLSIFNNLEIDTSFNIGTGFKGFVYKIKIDSDDKILVGGNFISYNEITSNRIIRLNSDGSIDTSFNIGTGFNNDVNDIQIDSDDKILVGGDFTTYNGVTSNRIIRLNSDGSIDTSFNIGTGFSQTVFILKMQLDGKILVGGNFTSYNGVTSNRIIRLNSDGSIDTSFNIGTGFSDIVRALQIQSDGKILVGGNFTSYNGVTSNRIIRLNSDGSIDTSFNIGTGFNDIVRALQIQSDGKILVGGNFATYNGVTSNRIIRLNSDGSRDTSFNIGTGFTFIVQTIEIQSDGKILVGGPFATYNGVSSSRFIILNSDGIEHLTRFTFNDGNVFSIQIQSDGKILLGGTFTSYSGVSNSSIIRLNYLEQTNIDYVIQDLRAIIVTSASGTDGGAHLIKGLRPELFVNLGTTITSATNLDGLTRTYKLNGGSTNGLNNPSGLGLDDRISWTEHNLYVPNIVTTTTMEVFVFNIRASLNPTSGIDNDSFQFKTGITTIFTTIQQNNSACLFTVNHGVAKNEPSLYFISSNRVYRAPLNLIKPNVTDWIQDYMGENPPGGLTTYPLQTFNNLSYCKMSDRLFLSGGAARNYYTEYNPSLSQFESIFLSDSKTVNVNNGIVPINPDTSGLGFNIDINSGFLHILRNTATVAQNVGYSIPLATHQNFALNTNTYLISPVFRIPEGNFYKMIPQYIRRLGNHPSAYFQPEPFRIFYRTKGITNNTGTWIRLSESGDLTNVFDNQIQFAFTFKTLGAIGIPPRLKGILLTYESLMDYYKPSKQETDYENYIISWRQDKLFTGNIPKISVNIFDVKTSLTIIEDDTDKNELGIWEYSEDEGVSWNNWDNTKNEVGNLIRYKTTNLPKGIKLKVILR